MHVNYSAHICLSLCPSFSFSFRYSARGWRFLTSSVVFLLTASLGHSSASIDPMDRLILKDSEPTDYYILLQVWNWRIMLVMMIGQSSEDHRVKHVIIIIKYQIFLTCTCTCIPPAEAQGSTRGRRWRNRQPKIPAISFSSYYHLSPFLFISMDLGLSESMV